MNKVRLKKIFALVLVMLALPMIASVFTSCSGNEKPTDESTAESTGETTNKDEGGFSSVLKNIGIARHAAKVENDEEEILKWKDGESSGGEQKNILPENQCTFDSLTSLGITKWSSPFGGNITLAGGNGGKYLRFTGVSQSWISPVFDLRPFIKDSGDYRGSFDIMLKGDLDKNASSLFSVAIRGGSKTTSFMSSPDGVNIFANLVTTSENYKSGEWYTVEFSFTVAQSDLKINDTWNLCLHMIDASVSEICIDDLSLSLYDIPDEKAVLPETTQTWISTEFVFNSDRERENPVMTCELDMEISCGDTTLKVPGFWDGGKTWKIRFALPFAGEWTYKTVCTDRSDGGLNGITGKIKCTEYSGELEIYRRGFLQIRDGDKYFTYADGTPFIYLGDTHWTMYKEEFFSSGVNAGNIDTKSHFCYIIRKRVEQGFTVIQSEPVESGLDVTNGIESTDILTFRYIDNYFAYIAKHGLVHANALLMFPSDMVTWMKKSGDFDAELRAAVRYWVARYSSYPVLWTLGQEVDKNFYGQFTVGNNPYVKMCSLVHEFDPLGQEITAHQENTSYTCASDSAFKKADGHSWYGVQWSPNLSAKQKFGIPKDYYSSEKPAVLYESLYDHLWTNSFGARAEGWIGMLSGMCGYGYGVEDVWYYLSSYDINTTSENHGIRVTPEDKAVKWCESVEFESAYQVGYMGDFLYGIEWWRLTPTFDNKTIFAPAGDGLALCANIEDEVFVVYSYDSKKEVGILNSLNSGYGYSYKWFDVRTGEYSAESEIAGGSTSFDIPEKPTGEDWVILVYRTE